MIDLSRLDRGRREEMWVSFRVLAVCVGNTCRSPVAERLLIYRYADGPGIDVESAGVDAAFGLGMTAESAAAVSARGGRVDGFRSRRVDADLLWWADLVLAATTHVRRAAVQEASVASRRAFTWKEFAALVDGRSAESPQALVADAAARRADVLHLDLDTDDPIGQPREVYARVVSEIDEAISVIARALRASTS